MSEERWCPAVVLSLRIERQSYGEVVKMPRLSRSHPAGLIIACAV